MTAPVFGRWSAIAVLVVGVAYALVLAHGMRAYGLETPIGDPTLAVMEVLTILSAFPVLGMLAAVARLAPPARGWWALAAVVFAALLAGTTTAVHVLELAGDRTGGTAGLVWPSPRYAAELVAWDVFLGAALLCGARAIVPVTRAAGRARVAMVAAGALALAGIAGPLLGVMRLQLIGVLGYAVLLPVVAWLLARWFAAQEA